MPAKKRGKKKNGGNKQANTDISYTSKHWKKEQRKVQGARFKEKQHQLALVKRAEPFEQQKLRIDAARDQANDLVYKFEQLEKIAKSLLATQEELGDQVTKIDSGRKKVIVSAKCIDTIWKDILTTYSKYKKLQDQIVLAKAILPTVTGRMMSAMVDGGEDEDGNDIGPQKIWIYDHGQVPSPELGRTKDPNQIDGHSCTDGNERINDLPPIDALEDETVGLDSTPAPSEEATLVDEFGDKCQLVSAAEDSGSLDFATTPSMPDVKNSDAGRGDQSENMVIKEQKNNPVEVGSGRKRKARDDSPVRIDSAEATDDEGESDDELEFICE